MTLPVLRSHTLRPAGEGPVFDILREMERMHQRMNQIFDAFLGEAFADSPWTPLADVTETDDAYRVEIEVPGVDRKDLTVEVAGSELRVTGEVVEKEKSGWLRQRTRRVGRFAYRLALPSDVDTDRITADLSNGVLTIRLPKIVEAKPRRITIDVN